MELQEILPNLLSPVRRDLEIRGKISRIYQEFDATTIPDPYTTLLYSSCGVPYSSPKKK
jgi:hypothetical protein